jgi:N12 class adenine-specific DNA methylase
MSPTPSAPARRPRSRPREFLALYPNARILVADETNFVKEKRHRFLSRASTANWDAIIITHSAFKFIPAMLDQVAKATCPTNASFGPSRRLRQTRSEGGLEET